MRKTDVLAYFKTTIRVADELKAAGYPATRQSVSNWGDIVPELTARRLSEISGGVVPLRLGDYRKEAAE